MLNWGRLLRMYCGLQPMLTNHCMCAVMLRQTIIKIERNGLSMLRSASKTPKPSLHTENCMLESGGIVGDVILFGFVT